MGDLAVGVVPYLGPGGAVMSGRVRRVAVLVGVKRIWCRRGDTLCRFVVVVRRTGFGRGRAHDNVGANRFEVPLLLDRYLVGQYEYALVTANGRREGKTDPRIAARRFDDRAAGL